MLSIFKDWDAWSASLLHDGLKPGAEVDRTLPPVGFQPVSPSADGRFSRGATKVKMVAVGARALARDARARCRESALGRKNLLHCRLAKAVWV